MASDVGGELKYIIEADDSEFVVKIQEASKNFKKFADTVEKDSSTIGKSLDKGFSAGTSSAIKSLGRLIDSAVNGFATISKAISSIGFNTLTTASGTAATALTTLVTGGISDTQFLENTQIQLQGLTHSIEDGNKAMAYATQYFKNNPFNRFDVTQATKDLIQFGANVEDVPALLEKMGKVSLSTGVNIAELANLYQRSSADGRVGLMDIEMLAQRGVPIWDAFSKAVGKSSAQIREETAKGGIAVADFQKAFEYLVDDNAMEQFNNTFSRQVDRFKGRISNMKAAIAGYQMTIDGGFTATTNGLYKSVTNLTKAFADAMDSEPGKKLLSSLEKLGLALAPLIDKFASLIPGLIEKAANALDYVASHTETLIPILGSALVLFGRLGATLPGIGGIIGSLGGNFSTILNILNPFKKSLGGVVTSFSALAVVLGFIGLAKNGGVPKLFEALNKAFTQVRNVVKQLLPVFIRTADILGEALLKSLEAILPTIPPIVQAVGKLANAFGRAVAAVAPTVFRSLAVALQAIAAVINAIPQPILNALVTGIVALAVAAKVYTKVQLLTVALSDFGAKLIQIKGDVTSASSAIKGGLEQVMKIVSPFVEVLGSVGKVVTSGLKTAATFVTSFGKAVLTTFANIGSVVITGIKAIASAVSNILSTVGKMVLDTFKPLAKGITKIFTSIGSVIWKGLSFVGDKLASWGSSLAGILGKGFSAVKKVAVYFTNSIVNAFTTIRNRIFTGASWLGGKVKAIFSAVGNTVVGFAKLAADKLVSFGNTVKNVVGNLASRVGSVLSNIGSSIAEFASKATTSLKQFGSKVADFMSPVTNAVKKFVSTATEAIKNFATSVFVKYLQPLGTKLAGIFDTAGTKVKGSLDKISGSFKDVFSKTKTSATEVGTAIEQAGTKTTSAFGKMFSRVKTDSDSTTNSLKNVTSTSAQSAANLAKAGESGKRASEGLKATKAGADAAKEGLTTVSDGVKSIFGVISETVSGIINVLNTLATGVTSVLQTLLGGLGNAIKALLEPLSDGNLFKGVGVLAGVATTLVIAAVALQLIASIDISWGTLLNNLLQMGAAVLAFGVLAAAVGFLMDTGIGAAVLASGLAAIAGIAATIMVTALAMKVAADSMPNNMGDVATRIGEGLTAIMNIDFGGFFKNMSKMGAAAMAAGTTAMVASIGKSLKEIVDLNLPAGEQISSQVNKITDAYEVIKDKFLENGGGVFGAIGRFFGGGENDSNKTVQLAAETTQYIKSLAEGLKEISRIDLPDKTSLGDKLNNIVGAFEIIRDNFLNRSDGIANEIFNKIVGKDNSDTSMVKAVTEVSGYIKDIANNVLELTRIDLPDPKILKAEDGPFTMIEKYGTTIKEKFMDDTKSVWQKIGEWFGGEEKGSSDRIETIKNVSGTLKEIANNVSEIAAVQLDSSGVTTTLTALETVMTSIKNKFSSTDAYILHDDVKTALEKVKSVADSLTGIGKAFTDIPAIDTTKTVSFLTNVGVILDKIVTTFNGKGDEAATVDIKKLDTNIQEYTTNAKSITDNMVTIGKLFTELPNLDMEKTINFLDKTARIISAVTVMFVEDAKNPFNFQGLQYIGIANMGETVNKVNTNIQSVTTVINNLKTIAEAVESVKLPDDKKIESFVAAAKKIVGGIESTFVGSSQIPGKNGVAKDAIKFDSSKWGASGTIMLSIANIVTVINNIKSIADAVANTNTSVDVTKFNTFTTSLGTMFDTIATSLEGKKEKFQKIGIEFGTQLEEGLKTREEAIYKQGGEYQGKIWNGIHEKINDIFELGKAFGDKFKDGVREKYDLVKEAGAYICDGLITGINSKSDQVVTAARNLAIAANNAFNETVDSHSPSRVFRQNGNWIGEGLVLGMEDQYKDVANTARGLAEAITEPFDDINDFSVNIAGQVSHDGESGYGNSQKTYNITQNNNISNGPSYAKMMADLKWEMFKS